MAKTQSFKTKAAALRAARAMRADGVAVKVYHTAGIYTQPGRGIVAFDRFDVVPVR